ncbi:MAG: hypothetical protein QF441_04805 [Bacteriovoracaceae bacterium]|jgi:hypothetical protein|nr:hypothetical protein [Bacteriovoracaceae bacterium]
MTKLLGFMLFILTTSSLSFATCEKEIRAKQAIETLKVSDPDPYLLEKLIKAEESIKEEGFCSGLTGGLNAVGFCIDLTMSVFDSISIRNNPMTIQTRYDTPEIAQALLAYGDLFLSKEEDPSTFNCELKRAIFRSLND